jgi:hypothetical protein
VTVAESQTTEGKNREVPGWGITVGQMLQRLGTDAVRADLHGDAWVLALFRRFGPAETVVISDVRTPNEEAAHRRRDGVVVNVVRPSGAAPGEAPAGRGPDHLEVAVGDVPVRREAGATAPTLCRLRNRSLRRSPGW